MSAPGGVGKTTLVLTLAWFLEQREKSVLLIDLDPSLGLTLALMDIQDYYNNIDKQKRTSADLLKAVHNNDGNKIEYKNFVISSRFINTTLNFISSSIRLEDVMGEIWYGDSLGRNKILKETLDVIPNEGYKYVLIDLIPCYGLKYALLNLMASDICIVVIRPTKADLGRTIMMMKELERKVKSEMNEISFQKKIYFLINMVQTSSHNEKYLSSFKDILLSKFPNSHCFRETIQHKISFTRVNIDDKQGDDKNVKDAFTKFYNEFEETFEGE